MDQKNRHSQNISAARERVIARCRELAALSRPHARRRTPEPDEGFIAVQRTIDAIDQLVGRDGRVATGKLLSFPARPRQVPPIPDIEPRRVRFRAGG
jgi:hypothetical protein